MENSLVDVLVYITKNDTQEVRIYKDSLYVEDGHVETYIWEEGNYSCDCNRRLFFSRVNGEEEDWDSGCSEFEYSVEIMYKGKVIYTEMET